MTQPVTGNDPLVDAIVNVYLLVSSENAINELDGLASNLVNLIEELSNKFNDVNNVIIPYKDITDSIFNTEQILLSDNIENFRQKIVTEASSKGEKSERILHLHDKFVEHILLAQVQRSFIERSILAAKETAEKAEQMADSAKETAEKAESIYESMFTNYITILGIFAAIIISIFGGLNIIKSAAISSLKWEDITKISSLLMICEITILYFLTNIIKNITQKEMKIEYTFITIIIVCSLIIIITYLSP